MGLESTLRGVRCPARNPLRRSVPSEEYIAHRQHFTPEFTRAQKSEPRETRVALSDKKRAPGWVLGQVRKDLLCRCWVDSHDRVLVLSCTKERLRSHVTREAPKGRDQALRQQLDTNWSKMFLSEPVVRGVLLTSEYMKNILRTVPPRLWSVQRGKTNTIPQIAHAPRSSIGNCPRFSSTSMGIAGETNTWTGTRSVEKRYTHGICSSRFMSIVARRSGSVANWERSISRSGVGWILSSLAILASL